MNSEFKLQFYFNLLKDKRSRNRQYFKALFEVKYGEFDKIDELINMIEEYQINKYGTMLYEFNLSQVEKEILKKLMIINWVKKKTT
jgi:hypothetical protein